MNHLSQDRIDFLNRLIVEHNPQKWGLDHNSPNLVLLEDGSGKLLAKGLGPNWTARAIVEFANAVPILLAEVERKRGV